MAKTVVVIGAAGDVGQGIVASLLASGDHVIAVGRNAARLQALAQKHPGIATVVGSVADESQADILHSAIQSMAPHIDAVIASVNEPSHAVDLLELSAAAFLSTLNANVVSHFVAAKTFIPVLADGGLYLVIGGGMADFVVSGLAPVSASQAALRMLVRHFAADLAKRPVHIRELLIASMVNGERTRDQADPRWLTDLEIGQHVSAILAAPSEFPGPIMTLRSRKQVGRPDPVS